MRAPSPPSAWIRPFDSTTVEASAAVYDVGGPNTVRRAPRPNPTPVSSLPRCNGVTCTRAPRRPRAEGQGWASRRCPPGSARSVYRPLGELA